MKKLTKGTTSAALLLFLGLVFVVTEAQARVVLASRGPRYHRGPADHEIVFEGGLAEPAGDQSDDFFGTLNGFGSSTGYEVGVRFRQYMGDSFAVSPAWHYTRYGTATGVDIFDGASLAYSIRTSNYRYGLDFQGFMGDGSDQARMFVSGGIALVNNRYRDELQNNGVFEATVNAPAYSLGLGAKLRNIELIAEYTYNRFDTANFSADGRSQSYNWDSLVVKMGLSFGR